MVRAFAVRATGLAVEHQCSWFRWPAPVPPLYLVPGLTGNCRSVLVADDPGELLKLRAFVYNLHMERRINRSEARFRK
jgi:hypothetical protein